TELCHCAPIHHAHFIICDIINTQLLFPLPEQTSVSLVITACLAMYPLLGGVLSAWIVVLATMSRRVLGMAHIGASKVDMADAPLEWVRTFALFGTYGIPVIAATLAYRAFGGSIPQMTASVAAAARITGGGGVLIVPHNF